MSICSDQIRLLDQWGLHIDDIVTVARAMETGPGFSAMSSIIDAIDQSPRDESDARLVIISSAEALILRGPTYREPSREDSNRSRRGMSDKAWRSLRAQIFERDEYICQYCGSVDDLTCDHITPLVRGGTNDAANLVTACRSCNSSKGDRHPSEWSGR